MVESPISGGKRVTSIAGILGMIRLRLGVFPGVERDLRTRVANALEDKYIVIITKAKLIGRIRGHTVYKIESTEFLPMQERALHVCLPPKLRIRVRKLAVVYLGRTLTRTPTLHCCVHTSGLRQCTFRTLST